MTIIVFYHYPWQETIKEWTAVWDGHAGITVTRESLKEQKGSGFCVVHISYSSRVAVECHNMSYLVFVF